MNRERLLVEDAVALLEVALSIINAQPDLTNQPIGSSVKNDISWLNEWENRESSREGCLTSDEIDRQSEEAWLNGDQSCG